MQEQTLDLVHDVSRSVEQVQVELGRDFLDDIEELSAAVQALAEQAGGATHSTGLVHDILREAVEHRATDIHLDPHAHGGRIRFRVDGRVIDHANLTHPQTARLINQVKSLANIDPVRSFVPQEARWTYQVGEHTLDLRLTLVPCVNGQKLAIRVLDPLRLKQSMGDLGLSTADEAELKGWLDSVNGMFLVTGPTGSGKTTLLYTLLHELRARTRVVVTIEDPVEYQIDGITQVQVDEKRGLTFAEGLKTMLRLDPDYLMLGEVRDGETARHATDASISGRALMTTLHSRDAVGAVSALRNWGLTNLEIAVSVSVVVAQRLVRTLCPGCKTQRPITSAESRWVQVMGGRAPQTVWDAVGCGHCRQQGYHGRVGVFETWRIDDEDYNLILSGADERLLRKHLAQKGHRTLVDDALDKAAAGVTSMAEIQAMAELIPRNG